MTPERTYSLSLATVGLGLAGFAAATLSSRELGTLGFLLLLSLLTSWLRVKLEPFGRVTMVPLLVFVALLLATPSTAIVLACATSAVGSRLFARNSWLRTLTEMGEEGLCSFVGALAFWSHHPNEIVSQPPILIFALAVILYTFTRIVVTVVAAHVKEGILVSNLLLSAGRSIFGQHVFLGIVAFALALLNRQFGILAVPLATVALAEFYYPAKLLSDQRDDLYISLAMIAHAIDLKDIYTGKHTREVAEIAVRIARAMRLPEDEVRNIRIAGLLHDIGKIGISGGIIRKPGKLTTDEMSTMRQHPAIGADIMQPVELLAEAANLVRHHHEHYDGSGYPDGLKGEDIPLGSRIVFVADAFNAITTDRPYRKARTTNEAFEILRENAGRQFDSKVVDALGSIQNVMKVSWYT
jgi:putative nucleotidyltransferase with HDIG domain